MTHRTRQLRATMLLWLAWLMAVGMVGYSVIEIWGGMA